MELPTGAATTRPTSSPRRALWLPVLGVVAGVTVLGIGTRSASTGLVVGCYFSGLVAVVSGVVVLRGGRRVAPGGRLSMTLLGAAIATWGTGQVLVGLYLHVGGHSYPTPADWISTVAAPLGIAGLLTTPRPPGHGRRWVRLALDSALLGGSLSLVIWRVGFLGVLFADGQTAKDSSILAMMVFEVVVVALLLLAWLRDLDRGLLVVVFGMAGYVVGDVSTLRSMSDTGVWPWWSAVLWCLAWPVIGLGLMMFEPHRSLRHDPYRSEARVSTTTTLLSVVTLVVSLLVAGRSLRLDAVSVAISCCLLVLFAARELLGSWQRQGLVLSLARHALHDPLTGLRNRRALAQALDVLDRDGGSVLSIDLDGFKEVNDILGHSRGDDLLVAVSRQIEQTLADDCVPYRTGGDEFAVLVPGDRRRAGTIADELLEAVRGAVVAIPGAPAIGVSASIGVSSRLPRVQAPADVVGSEVVERGGPALDLLAESSAAMAAAKRAGRDRVRSYGGDVAAAHQRGLALERRLREVLERGRIDVQYQPVVHLATSRVVGLEALARWRDDELGDVSPDEFIPVAEKCGLITRLGAEVARRAVLEFTGLGPTLAGLNLGVNVSAGQLRQPDYATGLLRLVADSGLEPHRLVVEVTESTFVDVDDPALRSLAFLRRSGVNVAIDDFGTGFSTLGYLNRLPANVIKVDRSLTFDAATDARCRSILTAVSDLAASLPADVVVEGIESEEQRRLVAASGATFGQGWLFSPAVPLADVAALAASWRGGGFPTQATESPHERTVPLNERG
ncbi:MAG TPA: bifunctional diguanylate cyclase/phosphodiesterase [Actinomycetales bacterium]|nr:bifunctional diguanylate cyclase/phosphodiesterase [Actinomycetales bacterium]